MKRYCISANAEHQEKAPLPARGARPDLLIEGEHINEEVCMSRQCPTCRELHNARKA